MCVYTIDIKLKIYIICLLSCRDPPQAVIAVLSPQDQAEEGKVCVTHNPMTMGATESGVGLFLPFIWD